MEFYFLQHWKCYGMRDPCGYSELSATLIGCWKIIHSYKCYAVQKKRIWNNYVWFTRVFQLTYFWKCCNCWQFSDVDLGEIIKNNIVLSKYEKPTPIQKYALPVILAKRDLMACAQTGETNNPAFFLVLLKHLLQLWTAVYWVWWWMQPWQSWELWCG